MKELVSHYTLPSITKADSTYLP